MKVTSLKDEPVWVRSTDIVANRFDALYYDPSLTIAEQSLRAAGVLKWKRLKDVSAELYSFGAYELTNQIKFVGRSDDSIPFINVTEISNPFVELEVARHIDSNSHRLLSKSVVAPETLLLSMSGSIGRVGVLPSNARPCNSNQHLAKLIIDKNYHDPYFLAAYFSCSIGQAACNREAAGAVQKELYLYNIATLPIPDPPKQIRLSIGNKLRSAEQLRAKASLKTAQATTGINKLFTNVNTSDLAPNSDGGCDFFCSTISSDRLGVFHGAQFYSPKRQQAVAAVLRTRSAAKIGDHSHRVRTKGKRSDVRAHIDPANINAANGYWSSGGDDEGGDVALAKPNHVLFMRMRPYLNKTTINCTNSTVSASPEFLIYEFEGIDAYYSTLCLRQPWALVQVAEIATGDRPRVDGDFVDEVLIPWPEPNVRGEIGKLYKESFELRLRAESLVKQAIIDVENLIAGCLDEKVCTEDGKRLASEFDLESPL